MIEENFFKKNNFTSNSNTLSNFSTEKIWNDNLKNIKKKIASEHININEKLLYEFIVSSIQEKEVNTSLQNV